MAEQRNQHPGARAKGVGAVLLGCGLLLALLGGPAGASTSPQITQAKKALLVLRDMPKGWTSSSPGNTNNPTPGAAQLARCLGVPVSVVTARPPTAYSRNFTNSDQELSVQDNVSIYASPRAARADFATFANPKTPACLTTNLNGPGRSEMESETGAGKGLGSIVVSREPSGDFAAHTANYVMFFPINTDEETINVQFTEVDYIRGDEEQTVGFTSYNSQFPPSLSQHLTALADHRI